MIMSFIDNLLHQAIKLSYDRSRQGERQGVLADVPGQSHEQDNIMSDFTLTRIRFRSVVVITFGSDVDVGTIQITPVRIRARPLLLHDSSSF